MILVLNPLTKTSDNSVRFSESCISHLQSNSSAKTNSLLEAKCHKYPFLEFHQQARLTHHRRGDQKLNTHPDKLCHKLLHLPSSKGPFVFPKSDTLSLELPPSPLPLPCMLQLCLTLCDPMDCNPLGSSVSGIPQARMLGWVAMPSSREIVPTQGSNLCLLHLLHQQTGSLPLAHLLPYKDGIQALPCLCFFQLVTFCNSLMHVVLKLINLCIFCLVSLPLSLIYFNNY